MNDAVLPSTETVNRLVAEIHRVLAPLLPPSGDFVLLDFPNYANVGDSAIWAGQFRYFADQGLCPKYLCGQADVDWNALDKAVDGGATIFISGGGNFGDIWEHHQIFRERVIERYRRNPIVQLPQSIHFANPERKRRTETLIREHGGVVLLARSHQSFELAKTFDCEVRLCPDMAFCLGTLTRPRDPVHEALLLLRTDKERGEDRSGQTSVNARADWAVRDWLDEPKGFSRVAGLSVFARGFLYSPHRRREVLYQWLSEARIARGLKILSSGRVVITDRLHAHILCVLMAIPHVVLDNSYRKVHGFVETWGTAGGSYRLASSLAEAVLEAEAMLAG